MAKLLIVEDEKDLAALLQFNFEAAGFQSELAATGAAALAQAKALRPDLVLLDVMLPDIPGTEVLRLIRGDPSLARTMVIIVSAKGQEQDRLYGLELGADDYIVKPFSVRELVLRAKAVLRRFEQDSEPSKVLKLGDIELDAQRHQVHCGAAEVILTPLEFRLLKTLLERPGRVQTREVLLTDVWQITADVTTRTVDTHLKRLREKLGPSGALIETVRGVGYRLKQPS